MMFASSMSTPSKTRRRPLAVAGACALLLVLAAIPAARAETTVPAPGESGQVEGAPTPVKPTATATLQQCLTSAVATERSATFAGEMTMIPGATRMEMQIDVLERMPTDVVYHMVTAPGLGVWRSSAPGVKAYTYLRQITNLAAPAFYRGEVRFRWLNAKGRLLRTAELRTRRCEQTAPETPETETPPTQTTASGQSTSGG